MTPSMVVKVVLAALAAIAIFLALDSTITGPARIDSYRRSTDDRHVTATVILSQVDAVIGQSLTEERDRIVESVRMVLDESGKVVREER